MKITLALLFTLAPHLIDAASVVASVAYDPVFDNRNNSLAIVACSDGKNGLLTKGFTTFGSLPSFPNIGAAPAVTSWNSTNCGTCWELTYTNSKGNKTSINITAVDIGFKGFVLSQQALDKLTGNQAVALGRVNATAKQVAASGCKL